MKRREEEEDDLKATFKGVIFIIFLFAIGQQLIFSTRLDKVSAMHFKIIVVKDVQETELEK